MQVMAYDVTSPRSNPNGMLIRFNVDALDPVVRMELDLADDGEPAIQVSFGVGLAFDGRYIRGMAFKPTRNGTWPLVVRAWTDAGVMGETTCRPGVTVTF